MKKSAMLLVGAVVAVSLLATDAFARGGGGGGRGGGGGGGRGGGGGGARPAASPAASRSPSMSRAAPAARPSQPMARPSQPAARPSQPAARPSQPAARPSQPVARPSQPAAKPGGAAQRPTAGTQPARPGGAVAQRPGQAPSRDQLNSFLNLPAGAGAAAGVAAGGLAAAGGPPHAAQLPSTAHGFGHTATGPGGGQITVGGVGGGRTGPGGAAVGAGRVGVKITGPGGNTYTKVAGGYCGCEGEGTYYDYGGNVTYDDDTVYYGNQPVASAEQYYDQAGQIAASGQAPQNEEWLPLGVFAVIAEPTQTQTDKVVQLALNKEGAVRGNLHDVLADKVLPVVGAVDKKTQRVAMKLEGNDSVVVETGLYNLTNDEVPVLVHFGPQGVEDRILIRLKQPEEEGPQP